MLNKSTKIIFFSFLIFLVSCGDKEKKLDNTRTESPEYLYSVASNLLNDEKFEEAREVFQNLKNQYPLTNEGINAQIMMAFIKYVQMEYIDAILQFDRIIREYPSHKNIDYAYYMRAMCYYEQIEKETLDGTNNKKALENFNQVIKRFPDSKYTRDSEQKVILVKENIAAKHMNIGHYYLKQKKYIAALNRYNKVINEYSVTKFTPEALYRQVEIYYALGILDQANKTASVISYNYPKSIWYEYAYNLLNKKDENKSFVNKLSNLLKKNDSEQ